MQVAERWALVPLHLVGGWVVMRLVVCAVWSVEKVVVVGVLLVRWGSVVNGFWRAVCCSLAG